MSTTIRLIILLACSPIVGFGTLLLGAAFPIAIVVIVIGYVVIDHVKSKP